MVVRLLFTRRSVDHRDRITQTLLSHYPLSKWGLLVDVLQRRARAHAALGDPLRLALVDRLSTTDLSPGEIAADFGMATNLVAHHLAVLVEAGIVERVRSEADRRRTYVRLARHAEPWLTSMLGLSRPEARPRRLLFVCTHNSARSQLAAAAWREHSDLPATSAGTDPAPRVNPVAVRVGRRHGLRLSGAPRDVGAVRQDTDLVIAVCDQAHESLPPGEHLHWSVPDPVRVGRDDAFEASLDDLTERIERLVTTLEP